MTSIIGEAGRGVAIWPDGPGADGAALLRLEPWRLHVAGAMTVATPRVWRADTEYR